jgi:hypothetical protein
MPCGVMKWRVHFTIRFCDTHMKRPARPHPDCVSQWYREACAEAVVTVYW